MDGDIKKPEGAQVPNILSNINSEKGRIEEFLDNFPGLRGYRAKNQRREADAMLRRLVSERLSAERLKLSDVYQTLSRDISLAIDHAEALGRVDSRLAGLIGKIEAAPVGYSGLFAAEKIDEVDLDRLYEFDASMLGYTDVIAQEIEALGQAVDARTGVATAVRALDVSVQEAATAFGARNELLAGIR